LGLTLAVTMVRSQCSSSV